MMRYAEPLDYIPLWGIYDPTPAEPCIKDALPRGLLVGAAMVREPCFCGSGVNPSGRHRGDTDTLRADFLG